MTACLWCFLLACIADAEQETRSDSLKAVQILIDNLGHEKNVVRRAAYQQLQDLQIEPLDHTKLVELLVSGAQEKDWQKANACHRLLVAKCFYLLRPSATDLLQPSMYMLPSDYPNRESIIEKYVRIAERQANHYNKAKIIIKEKVEAGHRLATALYCTDLLQAGATIQQVRRLLKDMIQNEQSEQLSDLPLPPAPPSPPVAH